MAVEFVLETGTGASNSTSYVSLTDFRTYAENQGYDISTLTDDEILKALLNNATKVLDSYYMEFFPGIKFTRSQALQFPRGDATDYYGYDIAENEIPIEMKNAECEMAYAKHTGTDLQPIVDTSYNLQSESIKVDVIEEKKTYVTSGGAEYDRDTITAVDDALVGLIGNISSNANMGIIRVGG